MFGSMVEIQTVQELFDALGGAKAVAEKFGLSRSAVGMWKTKGHLPLKFFRELTAASAPLGLTISDGLWPSKISAREPRPFRSGSQSQDASESGA